MVKVWVAKLIVLQYPLSFRTLNASKPRLFRKQPWRSTPFGVMPMFLVDASQSLGWGGRVLNDLQSIHFACILLYGLINVLNLTYPKALNHTFEAYQKILMDLDSDKLSPEVRALKLNLLI